jgi:hypothetical protein
VSALLLPGAALALREFRRGAAAMVMLWLVLGLLLLSILNAFPAQESHLVVVIPAMAIVYGGVIAAVASVLARWSGAYREQIAAGLASVAVIGAASLGAGEYYRNANTTFYPTLDQVVWFTTLDMEGEEQVLFVYEDTAYDGFVPWGVTHFGTGEHYSALHLQELVRDNGARERMRSAEAVVVDGRPEARLDYVLALLPGSSLQTVDDANGVAIAHVIYPGGR